jgi:hypothetical protein
MPTIIDFDFKVGDLIWPKIIYKIIDENCNYLILDYNVLDSTDNNNVVGLTVFVAKTGQIKNLIVHVTRGALSDWTRVAKSN